MKTLQYTVDSTVHYVKGLTNTDITTFKTEDEAIGYFNRLIEKLEANLDLIEGYYVSCDLWEDDEFIDFICSLHRETPEERYCRLHDC